MLEGGEKRKKEATKKEKLRKDEMQAALVVTGSMLDMVMDRMCVHHHCGYSTTCPGWWCMTMREKNISRGRN